MTPDQILSSPLLNKGTAFTEEERDRLHLHGFLPYQVSTLEEQVKRRYDNFLSQPSDLDKWTFLTALQNRNEILFYRLVLEHIDEMLPFVYTPTVGDVSLHFSALYTHPRGIYLSYPLQDKIDDIFAHLPHNDVDVIVVTDGERILGLGDLGAGGMAIPIGKSSLYTLFGGIHPSRTLPIMLDVGTNNKALLDDPLYLGWRHPRITGPDYDAFIDRFVQTVRKQFPKVLLQWEDFGRDHARPLLDRYRDKICSFNDDIQGTAAVVHAAILAATHLTQSDLQEQRILIFGGGSAGLGICHHLLGAMQEKTSEKEAKKAFYIFDKEGLVHTGQKSSAAASSLCTTPGRSPLMENVNPRKRHLAHPPHCPHRRLWPTWSLHTRSDRRNGQVHPSPDHFPALESHLQMRSPPCRSSRVDEGKSDHRHGQPL